MQARELPRSLLSPQLVTVLFEALVPARGGALRAPVFTQWLHGSDPAGDNPPDSPTVYERVFFFRVSSAAKSAYWGEWLVDGWAF